MKGRNQNALLMEIMIAVLFFAVCSTLLLNVFSGVHDHSVAARAMTEAMAAMNSLSARLYACEDAEAALADEGFSLKEDAWFRADEDFSLEVRIEREETGAGSVRNAEISAFVKDEPAGGIVCARYFPGEAM